MASRDRTVCSAAPDAPKADRGHERIRSSGYSRVTLRQACAVAFRVPLSEGAGAATGTTVRIYAEDAVLCC